MKTVPPDIDLTKPDLTLAMGCILTLRDGTVMGFTTHDRVATVLGVPLESRAGFTPTAVTAQNRLNVPNVDLMGFLDSAKITEPDIRAGRYRDAQVQLFLYDWMQPTAGVIKLPGSGWLGPLKVRHPIGWIATLLGKMQAYQANQGALYSNDCRNDLSDNFCKVDLTPFTQIGQVAGVISTYSKFTANALLDPFNTTTQLPVPLWQAKKAYYPGDAYLLSTDATFFYVVVQANSYVGGNVPTSGDHEPAAAAGAGDTITDGDLVSQATLHDWYYGGVLKWQTGLNVNYPGVVLNYTVGTPATFELDDRAPYPIQIGDRFSVEAGCGKLFYICQAKFMNQLNFNGENTAPGQESYMDYPDSETN